MPFAELNYIAILAAAAASFAAGAVYYGVLGKRWMAALGKTEEEVKAGMNPAIYGVAAVCQLVLAFMLAAILAHFSPDALTVGNALVSALLLWLGFVMTTMTVNHRFQGQPWSLTLIDGGHWLVGMLLQGVVLASIG